MVVTMIYNRMMARESVRAIDEKESKMNQAHNLMIDAFHHTDTSGVAAFARTAKGRRNGEVAQHLSRLDRLKALYELAKDEDCKNCSQ
jgi:hypothetical protein